MKVDSSLVDVYRTNSDNFATWTNVDSDINDGVARLQLDKGGVYVARRRTNVGLIVGLTVSAIAVVAIIVGGVVYFRRHPRKWIEVESKVRKAERSLKSNV